MNFCPSGDSLQTSKVSVINDTTDCDVICTLVKLSQGFPGDSVVKDLPANAGDADSIPGSGRSPGVGNGNPRQYSLMLNPMDGGAWWASVSGVSQSWTRLK